MLPEPIKRAALDALSLIPQTPSRDVLIDAIAQEHSFPVARIRVVAQAMTTAESGDDEEWWSCSHHLEMTYEHDQLVLESYRNNATVIGASQTPQYRITSHAPFDEAAQEQLQKWSALWREYSAIGKPKVWVSYC